MTQIISNNLEINKGRKKVATVSCSAVGYMLGGVKLGSGMTGKLGRAWVSAWLVHGILVGVRG